MLTMRLTKKALFSLVAKEVVYDILDDGKPVAVVTYLENKGGKITIDGKQYPIVRAGGLSEEMLIQALIRLVRGRKRVPASWTLTDADGKTLAIAEQAKKEIMIKRGEESFSLRKAWKVGHQLFRAGSKQPLCSTTAMDLPSEYDLPFRAFVLGVAIALAEEAVGADGGYTGN